MLFHSAVIPPDTVRNYLLGTDSGNNGQSSLWFLLHETQPPTNAICLHRQPRVRLDSCLTTADFCCRLLIRLAISHRGIPNPRRLLGPRTWAWSVPDGRPSFGRGRSPGNMVSLWPHHPGALVPDRQVTGHGRCRSRCSATVIRASAGRLRCPDHNTTRLPSLLGHGESFLPDSLWITTTPSGQVTTFCLSPSF